MALKIIANTWNWLTVAGIVNYKHAITWTVALKREKKIRLGGNALQCLALVVAIIASSVDAANESNTANILTLSGSIIGMLFFVYCLVSHWEDIVQLLKEMQTLKSRLDDVEKKLAEHEKKHVEHDQRHNGHDQRLSEHDQRHDGHDQRLSEHDQRHDGHDQRLSEHDQRHDGHDQRLSEHDQRHDGHDQRHDGLDRRFDEIDRNTMLEKMMNSIIEMLPNHTEVFRSFMEDINNQNGLLLFASLSKDELVAEIEKLKLENTNLAVVAAFWITIHFADDVYLRTQLSSIFPQKETDNYFGMDDLSDMIVVMESRLDYAGLPSTINF